MDQSKKQVRNLTTEKNNYNADSILVLDALSAIRKRVSLYLGSSDSEAIFHMWKEIFDNSADEHSVGHNNFIKIIINKDNDIIMADKGRGIPVDVKKQTGNPIIIDVLTKLHAGGKFDNKSYATGVSGTHGIGTKATNALSSKFQVWSFRNTKWHHVEFAKGKLIKNLNTKTPIPKEMSDIKQGTIVRFSTDFSCFDEGSKLSIKRVKEYCELQAFLHSGLKIHLKTPKNEYTFYEKDGLKSLLQKQLNQFGEEALGKPFIFSTSPVDIAISWSKNSGENVKSYASGSFTKEGGTHVNGLYDAIRDAIKPYKGKLEFTPAEARDGLVGTINVAVMQPKFSSQAKERLTNDDTTKIVYDLLKPALDEFFKNNKSLTKIIVQRAADLHKSYAKFTADRKSIAALKSKTTKALLSSKLARARTKDYKRIELFLVEGSSAGGCHFGGVSVLLADGSKKSFKTLVKDYKNGISNYGIAYDIKNNKYVPFEFEHPRLTKYVKEYVEIEFENGYIWRGTTDHAWLLKQGKYKNASSLQVGEDVQEIQLPLNLLKSEDF